MSDTITLDTTDAIPNNDGTGLSGYLDAYLATRITLAGGRVQMPARWRFTVTSGLAASFVLPITEDANPPDVAILLEYEDSQGRRTPLGAVVTPRAEGATYPLRLLLPVGGLEP